MKVRVRVHAGAKVERIETREGELHIWVKTPPVDGKANLTVASVLARKHGVPRTAVRLVSGQTSKTKVFEVEGL